MLTEDSLLHNVRAIEIRTDRLSDDFFTGGYHSVFKGQGIEFNEVREYAAGDDVRSIDWNVTARTGKPHVKRYVEERELTVMLVVDCSGSMDFGTEERTKAEAAAQVCALLAFSATKNNDKVGLAAFTDQVELFLAPRKGRRQVLRVIREVLYHSRGSLGTNLRGALEYVTRTLNRRAVLFVISDFRDEGYLDALAIARRKHDVIAVELSDPRERQVPRVGLIDFADAETGRRRLVDTSSRPAGLHLERWTSRWESERTRLFAARGIDRIALSTSEPPTDPLIRFFERRRRRLRR